jgi:azurin
MNMKSFVFSQCFLFVLILSCLSPQGELSARQARAPSEAEYYVIDPMPVPDGIVLEAGGLAFGENGELMVPTRRGEVWCITNPGGINPSFSRFAQGLHEPLGIAWRNGGWYVAQRGELVRLDDRNNDGRADRYRTVYRWPLTGNYHEYSYGPKFLPNGEMMVTLNLAWIGHGAALTDWRGWMLHITEEGEMTPWATGLRSPLGFGLTAVGDIFYTENQGGWVGSGWLTHLERGDFAGNPEGLKWTHMPGSPLDLAFEEVDAIDDTQDLPLHAYAERFPDLKLPAVWFPHAIMGISTADILFIENDNQVGPFAGQLLVADQGHSKVMRVFLEKVNGQYQGAVFGFREGFSSGVIKLAWGPDDVLYAGMTNRGWASTGREPYGIDRMRWTGKIPFEMRTLEAESDGFTITFTKPVDPQSAADVNSYRVTGFTYIYTRRYGSPVINRQEHPVTGVVVAEDGMSARIYVEGMREKYIHEVRAEGVRSAEGAGLLHPTGYYTLNHVPEGERGATVAADVRVADAGADEGSPKKITTMPAGWNGTADQTIALGTVPGMRFSRELITVRAGNRVALSFTNDDDMLHNVVIVRPGTADPVGEAAMRLGLDGDALEYVPPTDQVLVHTSLLGPREAETIYFTVPDVPGDYQFVCTFPGHHITMRGILRVE